MYFNDFSPMLLGKVKFDKFKARQKYKNSLAENALQVPQQGIATKTLAIKGIEAIKSVITSHTQRKFFSLIICVLKIIKSNELVLTETK